MVVGGGQGKRWDNVFFMLGGISYRFKLRGNKEEIFSCVLLGKKLGFIFELSFEICFIFNL